MRGKKPILLVEDDAVDIMIMQRAFKDLKIANHLDITHNGEEALELLRAPSSEKPCIIFLDLNMPRMNGIEFLKIIKQDDDRFKKIPVVVLTTSKEEQDKVESFNLGVAGYMIKPPDYRQFVDVIKTIDLYWTISEFPN